MLEARNIDVNKVYNDGHNLKPCIPSLRLTGAYLTWWAVNLGSTPLNTDAFTNEQNTLLASARDSFESALPNLDYEKYMDGDKERNISEPGTVYCYR